MKKQFNQVMKVVALAMIVASSVVACQKKNSGSVQAVVNNPALVPFEICSNCPTSRELIAKVGGRTDYGLAMSLDLFGDAAVAQQAAQNMGAEKLPIFYNGVIAAGGQVTLNNLSAICNTNVSPGTFLVRTLSVGSMQNSMIYNLRLELLHSNLVERMVLNIPGAMLVNSADTNGLTRSSVSNRIVQPGPVLRVESVNGQPCPGGSYSLGSLVE